MLMAVRHRFRVFASALACALVVLLGLAAASEARRAVPFGFVGVAFGESALSGAPVGVQDAQLAQMAQSGAESLRLPIYWRNAEPARGVFLWGATDAIVGLAARHGLDVLPQVGSSPQWASARPDRGDYYNWGPADPRSYTDFLVALIGRYGPRGSFWAANPGLPRRPIRAWQIWNEPGFRYFFADPNYRRSYPRLLIAAYNAIKRADRGAKVVTAGLANSSTDLSWRDLEAFYRAGLRGHYDVLALHPYALNPTNMTKIIAANRAVLRRHRDAGKPIWLTEMTWSASAGRIPPQLRLNLEVTQRQQERYLRDSYRLLARNHSYGVQRVYWWTWATTYQPISVLGSQPSFEFAGLTKATGGAFQPQHVLSVYRSTARGLEGCAKTSVATRCR
jgi:Glycosyl hydrolase catalytic core